MFNDFLERKSNHPASESVVSREDHARGDGRAYLVVKRTVDLAMVMLTAPISLPLIGALALLVRLDGGPAFFGQERLGRDGRIFMLWKLRSMVPDAEARLERHLAENPAAKEEWAHAQKLKKDPRVTRLGRFLRKYSLDELPQLWNVLIGDMSLVGPRPMFPAQRSLYPGIAYFDLRPGLTGLWQVSERNRTSFAERAHYDDRYAESVSLGTDLHIIFRTVAVIFRGTGC
ncbi:MAG TPA: sugar transferase [Devosiaceae bacterium]|jgi:lipopolysaccharide/colanic/teichoic acid biosynthesis glycosyltransferase|nr:sugar transferase [Devosiaceae bacterium]